jgi:hypothetical protein
VHAAGRESVSTTLLLVHEGEERSIQAEPGLELVEEVLDGLGVRQ